MQEEREVKRKEMQRQGASVIIDQIKEREIERIKEEELREKEMAQMQRQIEQLKQEEKFLRIQALKIFYLIQSKQQLNVGLNWGKNGKR